MQAPYDPSSRVGRARERYFERAGLEPGYDDAWVRVPVGPLTLRFPNAAGRRRAVKLHDLHHVATGYDTSWVGEAEIGAWEIAGGCAHHVWAWGLNLSAMAVGLVIAPGRTFRAFVRGRHSRTLYRLVGDFDPSLLGLTVAELRERMQLAGPDPRPGLADRIAFGAWVLACAVSALWLPALVLALGIWLAAP